MATTKYAFEAGGEKRLEISWQGIFKQTRVILDGNELGSFATKADLERGQSFSLPDGSTLDVRLSSAFAGTELQVLRNGRPLPGSPSDPAVRLKGAVGVLYFIAGLNALLGLVASVADVELLKNLGIGWFSIAFGLVYLVLGYFTSRRSKLALGVAVGLFIVDGLVGLAQTLSAAGTPGPGGIVMRVFLVLGMIRGFKAIDDLKKQPSEASSSRAA